jgi:hypothetical protein
MSTASVKAAQKFADAIAKDEFLRDANVDMRGFPSMQPVEDTSFIDERFAPMDSSGAGQGSKDLKAFLQEQIDESQGSTVVHVGENEFRVFSKDGLHYADGQVGGKRHRYSSPDKDALYDKLMALARKTKKDAIRELTESQLLEVARIAVNSRPAAVNKFLEYALPLALIERYDDPNDAANDPALRSFMDDVCRFVWINSRLDATDSEDWRDFSVQFIGDRPLSGALLDYAWQEFSSRKNRLVFADLPRTQGTAPEQATERVPTASDLENFSDEEIAAQMKRQARYNAEAAHGPRAPYPQGHAYLEAEAAAVA